MSAPDPDAPPGVDVPAMRARLVAEREALMTVSQTTAEARSPVVLDQSSVGRLSRMDAMQQQAMALATERRRAATLARIDAALARVASGDYGWCTQCGEAVAPGRLDLDPATPTCVACAARAQG